MDEEVKEIRELDWPKEIINDKSLLYRVVSVRNSEKQKTGRRIPNEAAFALRAREKGLSLNWDRYCCEKKSLIAIGLRKSQHPPYNFIDVSPNIVFKLPANFIKEYGNLEHTPIYKGDPSPVGKPNNISHSELFPDNDIQMRMDFSDYCRNEYEASSCKVDMKQLQEELSSLRERLNNTPYHKDWNF